MVPVTVHRPITSVCGGSGVVAVPAPVMLTRQQQQRRKGIHYKLFCNYFCPGSGLAMGWDDCSLELLMDVLKPKSNELGVCRKHALLHKFQITIAT
jgi:hypothetical protein